MKKFYTKATMDVVMMETEQHLLANSAEDFGDEMGYIRLDINPSRFA